MKKTVERVKNFICPDMVWILLLILYSLRFVNWGVDMWDAGYSYVNFQYMGYEHMDPMWMFSTYLANAVGNFLTKLPFANTLLGMNFYTTLFIAAIAVVGYLFFTRILTMAKPIAFLGEIVALSLCWCPSAVLYNYLSYLLMALCVVLLYKGLVEEKKWFMFAAGICLGANVLTRFSNLPQMALILAVWMYGVLGAIESKEKGYFKITVNRTLWCLGGYLTGLIPLLGYIHIRYGLDAYINGIVRLFSMTDTQTDYQPLTMVLSVLYSYYINLYWIAKMVVIALVGTCIWRMIEWLKTNLSVVKTNEGLKKLLTVIAICASLGLVVFMVRELYVDGFCTMDFLGYDSVKNPSIIFMFMAMLIAFLKFIHKEVCKEEKLVGIMVVLVLLISSVGSNNGIYSGMNNLFLIAPYVLWNCYLLLTNEKFKFPVKAMLGGFLAFYLYQVLMFGTHFYYVEATGERNATAVVENNALLAGIKMNPEKAEQLTGLYDYVLEHDLEGRESIVMGQIPSVAYYLQMPPAFNPWIDLGSYSKSQLESDLQTLQSQIDKGEVETPVIIVSDAFVEYEPYGDYKDNPKWTSITEFMNQNGYEKTYIVDTYTLYEARK